MKPSENAENLITQFEGCKLEAYKDIAGVWTIGHGHTRGVTEGAKITAETAGLLLLEDLDVPAHVLEDAVKVPLTQNQYDALCSFIFNVGDGAFRGSTMLKLINAFDFEGAALQFPRWDKARVNGEMVSSPGILRRRLAEQVLFRTA